MKLLSNQYLIGKITDAINYSQLQTQCIMLLNAYYTKSKKLIIVYVRVRLIDTNNHLIVYS